MPDDLVATAVAELYAGSPDTFTARRAELVAAARAAGDQGAARAIGALRRPTRAAWVVNQLTRSDPAAPGQLAELSAAMLAAQQAGNGARLRELSAARGPLLDALTDAAFGAAGLVDPPPGLRAEVTATLAAALADPEVGAGLAAGTLTKAAQWAGFGPLPAVSPAVVPIRPAAPATGVAGRQAVRRRSPAAAAAPQPAGARSRGRQDTPRRVTPEQAVTAHKRRTQETPRRVTPPRVTPEPAATARERRAEEEAGRLAAEAAERTARQRRAFEESERMLAESLTATAAAATAEERLEAEVRELEERLTQTRAELAAARLRARRAEAAERRARLSHARIAREST